MSQSVERTEITGTLDELEPRLRELGFSAVETMAGPLDLAQFDPYGMRRPGSVNLQGKWAPPEKAWRGVLAYYDGRAYLTDAKIATSPFINGMFPLVRSGEPFPQGGFSGAMREKERRRG